MKLLSQCHYLQFAVARFKGSVLQDQAMQQMLLSLHPMNLPVLGSWAKAIAKVLLLSEKSQGNTTLSSLVWLAAGIMSCSSQVFLGSQYSACIHSKQLVSFSLRSWVTGKEDQKLEA